MKRFIVVVTAFTAAIVAVAGPASAVTGGQSFLLISQGAGGSLIASGPISGSGKDVVLSDTQDRFVFTGGSVFVTHQPTRSHDSFNEFTCTGTFNETGTYQLAGGTGRYAGASGGGTYHVTAFIQVHRTAKGCTGPASQSVLISAHGSTTLP